MELDKPSQEKMLIFQIRTRSSELFSKSLFQTCETQVTFWKTKQNKKIEFYLFIYFGYGCVGS